MRKGISIIYFAVMQMVLLSSCSNKLITTTQPPIINITPEINFEVIIKYGACFTDTYNSNTGVFTKDMGLNKENITATFQLLETEKVQIVTEMYRIDFLNYPDVIILPTSTNGIVGRSSSIDNYYLCIINGNKQKTIDWSNDVFDPLSKEATEFINFFNSIRKIIEHHPEVLILPDRGFGCV